MQKLIEIDGKKYIEVTEHYMLYRAGWGFYEGNEAGDFVDLKYHPTIFDDREDLEREIDEYFTISSSYHKAIPKEELFIVSFYYAHYLPWQELEDKEKELYELYKTNKEK